MLASIVGVFSLLAHVARTEGDASWYTGLARVLSAALLMVKEQINGLILLALCLAPR